ncbi:hypothetical protein JCM10212_002818 [Sporobolomyces blumeae]
MDPASKAATAGVASTPSSTSGPDDSACRHTSDGTPAQAAAAISDLPPELLNRVIELAVEGLPPGLQVRSDMLRNFALVASSWRVPAQVLLETKVHLGSYSQARAFIRRPRRLDRPLILDEVVIFFDFVDPQDDEFYPLTEWIVRELFDRDVVVRSLHLRSVLFVHAFDTSLLLLPAFRELRHLRLEMPIEPPYQIAQIPLRLSKLSLSAMMDQSLELFRALLPSSAETLVSLHIFWIKSGSPLHEHVLTVLPNLPSTLRHLSLASHWTPMPESLLRLATSCRNLSTLVLTGIDLSQVRYLVGAIPSLISALDLTIPASSTTWTDDAVRDLCDDLLHCASSRRLRELSIVQRIEARHGGAPSRFAEQRGAQSCMCRFERTARKHASPIFTFMSGAQDSGH